MMNNVTAIKRPAAPAIFSGVRRVYENYLKRQDDIKKKKLEELFDAVYDFYLDLYLTNTKGTVDIPEIMYRNGNSLCDYALKNTSYQMMQVINEGRINQCYTALKRSRKNRHESLR